MNNDTIDPVSVQVLFARLASEQADLAARSQRLQEDAARATRRREIMLRALVAIRGGLATAEILELRSTARVAVAATAPTGPTPVAAAHPRSADQGVTRLPGWAPSQVVG